MVITDKSPEFFPHYVSARVLIKEDYDTGRVDITAHIGTAPDDHTVIVYPYRAYESEYMNKANARKLAANMKRDLKQFLKDRGIKLTEELQMSESWRYHA